MLLCCIMANLNRRPCDPPRLQWRLSLEVEMACAQGLHRADRVT
jgi:hypothetical protein